MAGKLAKTFLPDFEAAYYIHNFKGTKGECLGCLYSLLLLQDAIFQRTCSGWDVQLLCRRCSVPCLPWALAGVSATTQYGNGEGAHARQYAHTEAGGPGDSASDMTFSVTPETRP